LLEQVEEGARFLCGRLDHEPVSNAALEVKLEQRCQLPRLQGPIGSVRGSPLRIEVLLEDSLALVELLGDALLHLAETAQPEALGVALHFH
jgi:hypothetical protein